MKQASRNRWITALAIATSALLVLPAGASAAKAEPNGLIAFASNRDGDYDIYVQAQDGSGLRNVTNTGGALDEYDPAWSPDGQRILYTHAPPGGADTEIAIINLDGTGQAPITNNDFNDFNAVFSPDGTQIAWAPSPMGISNIFLMTPAGVTTAQLTFGDAVSGANFAPDWSPDGQRITFLSDREGGGANREVYVMNRDGSGQAPLTANAEQDLAPKFSPDGKLIIWAHGSTQPNQRLFTMPATGGAQAQVGSNTVRERGAAFSRDGLARIFFVQTDPGNDEIYLMNADGSGKLPFAGSPNADLSPAPQPAVKCGKKVASKVATIVGTDASETLVGGPGPDVIAGFGGKDTIKGLGGKDQICGAGGNDKLNGGKGNDRILGGRGNDKLNGGKGKKNVCLGGKGLNTGVNCQKEKKISS